MIFGNLVVVDKLAEVGSKIHIIGIARKCLRKTERISCGEITVEQINRLLEIIRIGLQRYNQTLQFVHYHTARLLGGKFAGSIRFGRAEILVFAEVLQHIHILLQSISLTATGTHLVGGLLALVGQSLLPQGVLLVQVSQMLLVALLLRTQIRLTVEQLLFVFLITPHQRLLLGNILQFGNDGVNLRFVSIDSSSIRTFTIQFVFLLTEQFLLPHFHLQAMIGKFLLDKLHIDIYGGTLSFLCFAQFFRDLGNTFLPFLLQHSFGIVALLPFFLFSTNGNLYFGKLQLLPFILFPLQRGTFCLEILLLNGTLLQLHFKQVHLVGEDRDLLSILLSYSFRLLLFPFVQLMELQSIGISFRRFGFQLGLQLFGRTQITFHLGQIQLQTKEGVTTIGYQLRRKMPVIKNLLFIGYLTDVLLPTRFVFIQPFAERTFAVFYQGT